MNRVSNILGGLFLVGIGIIFGLNALEITDIDIFFDGWWTFFLIIPCFLGLFKAGDKTANIIGLLIGIALLLVCQDILDFRIIYKLTIPAILIIIGLSIIFKGTIKVKIKEEIQKVKANNSQDYCATFGIQEIDFTNEKFTGCNLNSIFGEVKCNLQNSKIKENVVINACSVFGGITIYVPLNVNIKIISTPIFGGVSDERKNKIHDATTTLYINATCIFGGVVIK